MIKEGSQVTMVFKLKDDEGHVWDESTDQQPFVYTQGQKEIMSFLENALEGKAQGEEVQVTIPPEQAYGEHDPNLIRPLPKEHFAHIQDLEVGMAFQPSEDQNLILRVVEIGDDSVTVDGNHPLAGKTLNFDIKIVKVEDPS